MKKLISATAAAAFILATGSAMAEDTNPNSPTQKTPTEQQLDTKASEGTNLNAQTPTGTTGAAVDTDADIKAGADANGSTSMTPGKPTDTIKESTDSK